MVNLATIGTLAELELNTFNLRPALPCPAPAKPADNLDNISSKTLLEKRWQYKYRSLMDTLSQFNVEDETNSRGGGVGGGNSVPRTPVGSNRRTYLTIQGVPRRPRSYLQLENNLRNLFDGPPPAGSPPPPAVVIDHDNSQSHQSGFHRSNSYNARSRTNS